jgi:hypothetical protein
MNKFENSSNQSNQTQEVCSFNSLAQPEFLHRIRRSQEKRPARVSVIASREKEDSGAVLQNVSFTICVSLLFGSLQFFPDGLGYVLTLYSKSTMPMKLKLVVPRWVTY